MGDAAVLRDTVDAGADQSLFFPAMDKSLLIERDTFLQSLLFVVFWEVLYWSSREIMRAGCRWYRVDKQYHSGLIHVGPAYVVSFVNATLCVVRGAIGFYKLRPLPIEVAMCGFNVASVLPGATSAYLGPVQYAFTTSKIFMGYMIYDMIHLVVEFPKFGGIDMVIHHIVFLSGIYLGVASKALVLPFCWLIFTELSTLFLNARWFLIKSGNGDSPAMAPTTILFAVTFFISRVVFYGLGTLHFAYNVPLLRRCLHPFVGPIVLGIIFTGQLMNLFWFYKIARIAMRGGKKAVTMGAAEKVD